MKLQYLGYFNELETDKKSLVEHIALTLMVYSIDFADIFPSGQELCPSHFLNFAEIFPSGRQF